MAKARTSAKRIQPKQIFQWSLDGFLTGVKASEITDRTYGTVIVAGQKAKDSDIKKHLPPGTLSWENPFKDSKALFVGASAPGPLIIASLHVEKNGGDFSSADQDFGFHAPSPYALARDLAGNVLARIEVSPVKAWRIIYLGQNADEQRGFLVGLALADYRYLRAIGRKPRADIKVHIEGFKTDVTEDAGKLATAVNLARHLVNTPPNELNPATYADAIEMLFSDVAYTKVEVWGHDRLKKEGMGLILAVGQGAQFEPRMVKISYRPKGAKNQPIAFVGKGITFDTGGLDLKPDSAMRLMKKDMGGSAVVASLAYWAATSSKTVNCDFYLALAENAVDQKSYRPSDVYMSRSGISVEIHNTDAEGRLVLADVLDVAATQTGKDRPSRIINVATLTGAAKVGVGMELGSLFATDSKLTKAIGKAGQIMGDHVWPLPFYEPYARQLKTQFADTSHCSTGKFAGAITAALFLRKFVRDIPFVHLDIGAWGEVSGAIRESGGNGQMVQALAAFLDHHEGA